MSYERELLKGNFATLLLAILDREGEMYGYQIAKRLNEMTEGRISPGQSTLYPALHHLQAAGHVTAKWRQRQGRRRKYYTLTSDGRANLAERRTQWREFCKTVETVLQPG